MNEELLQYIWRYKYLLNQKLQTTRGEPVQIILPGQLNRDSGPDFFNARLQLGNTIWAGNIEVHIKSSDWKKHKHQLDKAYDNVILHVVLEHDEPVFNRFNEELPTLELKKLLPQNLLTRYQYLKQSQGEIPCEKIFELPDELITGNWFERLSVERLENKCIYIFELLKETNNHWEHVFYRVIARYFGQKINELPFELLAKQLPMNVLARNKHNLLQTQALVLGVSGLLNNQFNDDYLLVLKREYNALQNKYQLTSLDKSVWKFGKTRPANFPTVRLLQFAELVHQSTHLFAKLIDITYLQEAEHLFTIKSEQLVNTAAMHSKKQQIKMTSLQTGKGFVNLLLINVAVPILFAYGKWIQEEQYGNRALKWLNQLKPEENNITTKWRKLGLHAVNAKQTQALIALNNYYCKQKQCLRCAFGNHILNKNNE
ncbi:MAG: DUF2851 family protein [Bacteroidia bacterium]|nr:DUF2851 family protein [Bacteroidia bacterium]